MAPHKVTRPEQVDELATLFSQSGWGAGYEALVGYVINGNLQLLSGTHRRAAAQQANIKIPVVIIPSDVVKTSWGHLESWNQVMKAGYGRL